MMSRQSGKPQIVIIGGGFGGLYAAKNLKKIDAEITLIDRRNFHLFQPLLYQVATGGLSPGDIASPIRAVLKKYRHIRVLQEEVSKIDAQNKEITTNIGKHPFDYLIVAAGANNFYFGNNEWQQYAPGLKSIEDALQMRRRILRSFEAAEAESDPEKRQALLTFLIIGGGPTGVELAGALAELANYTLKNEFRAIDPAEAQVIIVEGGPAVLSTYPEPLTSRAEKTLNKMGVKILTDTMVTDIKDGSVVLKSGEEQTQINCQTVLWAAGVKASPLANNLAESTGAKTDKGGRIIVEPDLSLPGHPDIFAIGDIAHFRGSDGNPLPGVAPVAMQQGHYLAKLLKSRLRGQSYRPFSYTDKGSLAVIGRNAAIAHVSGLKVSGWIAWLIWIFVHIAYLIGFDNKLLVLFQWFTNYVTRNRGARLITAAFERS